MRKSRSRRTRAGFTLIEIMAVVLIIGMLSSFVGYAVFQRVDEGRNTATKVQLQALVGTLEMYRMDNGKFPTTEQGLEALIRAAIKISDEG